MSRAKRIFTSAAWNHAGKLAEYFLAYLSAVLIARGLGVMENGVFAGLISFSQFMSALSSLGLETSLNKHIPQLSNARSQEQVRYLLRRLMGIRLVLFAVVAGLVFVLPALAGFQLPKGVDDYLVLLVVFTACRSLVPLVAMTLIAQLKTEINSRITLLVRLMELVGIIVLFELGMVSILNLILLFLAATFIHIFAFILVGKSELIGGEHPLPLRPVLAFGGLFWLNTISEFILGRQGDVLFLSSFAADTSQASLYDVAYSVAQFSALGMTIGFGGVTFAAFASLAIEREEAMNRFYAFLIRIVSLLTIPLFTFLLWNGRSVIQLLYSEKFDAAFSLLQVILAFRIVSRLFGGQENAEYLLSKGSVAPLVAVGLIGGVCNVVLNIVLIPEFGAFGTTIASGTGNFVANVLAALLVYKATRGGAQFAFWAKLTVIGLASSFLCHVLIDAISLPALLGQAFVYTGVLIVLLGFIKPLTQEDSRWLIQVNSRLKKILQPFTSPAPSF